MDIEVEWKTLDSLFFYTPNILLFLLLRWHLRAKPVVWARRQEF